jgi:CubicO group peptidase (beta-lactamase class C family)
MYVIPFARFPSLAGCVVVQQLLTDVTGKSFPALMRDLVFEPVGMTHSTFDAALPKNLWSEVAQPCDGARNDWFNYSAMAPAGLWTTPSDLVRFAIEIRKPMRDSLSFSRMRFDIFDQFSMSANAL